MSEPYKIEGPAIISFSGGRTSGFMLAKILEAHNGKLPSDIHVCFENTGLEHEATLRFVKQVDDHWNVGIKWLEYAGNKAFRFADFSTAKRNGEPFTQLLQHREILPNPIARMCTSELKVRVERDFARSIGWEYWTKVLGLRADEPRRVANAMAPNRDRWDVECPIAKAKHTIKDVLEFWATQSFDLNLPENWNGWGNCKGCFLKSRRKIEKIAHDSPNELEWWAQQEEKYGMPFRKDRPTYRQILTQVSVQGHFDEILSGDDDTIPCMCTE